jgi:hypothetical protein
MKDKLIKTNHSANYYRFKKFATLFSIFFGLGASLIVPITIKITVDTSDKQNIAGAEDNSSSENISSEELSSSELLNYE